MKNNEEEKKMERDMGEETTWRYQHQFWNS